MTMTLEQAIKIGDDVNYRAPEARHGYAEAARLLADALAAARQEAEALRALLREAREIAAAQCSGAGHWSPPGAPEGPGHTVQQCVRYGCDECGCSGRFWKAFAALDAAGVR